MIMDQNSEYHKIDIKLEDARPKYNYLHLQSFSRLLLALFVFSSGWITWNYKDFPLNVLVQHGRGIKQCDSSLSISTKAIAVNDFDWGTITPSEKLTWSKCYQKFECARLSVPLDYNNISDYSEKAYIAITKLSSKYSPDQDEYRGPVLFNPGGPGGSGVEMILGRAESFREIIGDDFDLIGFDPRGVGFTKPGIEVFSSEIERNSWFMRQEFSLNATSSSLGKVYARTKVMAQLVRENANMKSAAAYVSTPVVARDMLSITKAHGRDKLLYWGFSYGTLLGATYAAMFPDNIDRLIIDGVVDAENYYATLWSNNLNDTDAELMDLYQACVSAGPESCPIYEENAIKIKQRVDDIIEKLKLSPLPFVDPSESYGVIDGGIVKYIIFTTLYKPYTTAKNLTVALAEIEKGNPLPMSRLFHIWKPLSCNCKPDLDVPFASGEWTPSLAIACSDGEPVEETLEEIKTYYSELAESSLFAENWDIRVACNEWPVQGKERIDKEAVFANSTSHPILLIGNTRDPVTPLWNAHKMSKAFGGSVVLTQNSLGHCSISAASLCTTKYIREYFRNGTLPPENTTCEVESSVFNENLLINIQNLSADDEALLRASRELMQNPIHHMPL